MTTSETDPKCSTGSEIAYSCWVFIPLRASVILLAAETDHKNRRSVGAWHIKSGLWETLKRALMLIDAGLSYSKIQSAAL